MQKIDSFLICVLFWIRIQTQILAAKNSAYFIEKRFMQCERHFFEKTQNDLFNFQNDFPIFYDCLLFQVEQEFGHSLNLREYDFLNTQCKVQAPLRDE